MGIVPQELNIDPFFTPYELLEIQAGLYGIRKKERKTMEIPVSYTHLTLPTTPYV